MEGHTSTNMTKINLAYKVFSYKEMTPSVLFYDQRSVRFSTYFLLHPLAQILIKKVLVIELETRAGNPSKYIIESKPSKICGKNQLQCPFDNSF